MTAATRTRRNNLHAAAGTVNAIIYANPVTSVHDIVT